MKSLKFLVAVALSFSFVACESPDQAQTALGPTLPSKPLPSLCSQDLLARLTWMGDNLAFGYTIEVGTTRDVYTQTYTVSQTEKSFLLALGRGSTYFLRATKYLVDGSITQFEKIELFVPTCDQREAWQKAHPDYAEPFDHMVIWSN